jgi:hypothetical protein
MCRLSRTAAPVRPLGTVRLERSRGRREGRKGWNVDAVERAICCTIDSTYSKVTDGVTYVTDGVTCVTYASRGRLKDGRE